MDTFAKFERELMRSRTMHGPASARARGRMGGRKPKLSETQVAQVKRTFEDGLYINDIAEIFGVSRPTVYRVLEGQ
jgi:DNA invertase Pin-like site-specific DNA recombinase